MVTPSRTAYGYVRVSTAEQAEHKTSLKQQADDIEAYCAKNVTAQVVFRRGDFQLIFLDT